MTNFRLTAIILTLSTAMIATSTRAADKFHWVRDDAAGTAELKYGEQPVVTYMYAYDDSTLERRELTYKTYHHVYGPGTKTIITKGPGGLYPHHRGLYVAWNKTGYDGTESDFWHGSKGNHQRHITFFNMDGDEQRGTM